MKVRRKIGDLGKEQIRQLIQDFLDELDEGAVAILEHFEESDNPEFLEVEVDEENKMLSFTAKDGSHYAYNLKSETIDALAERVSALEEEQGIENFENIEDPEGRLQIGKDAEDKIFNYRKQDGTLVESVGVETPEINLSQEGLNKLAEDLNIDNIGVYKTPNIPKYGYSNIKQETFYLTANPNVDDINDVVLIYDFANTDANANDRMSIAHYYVYDSTIIQNPDGTYSPTENSIRLRHYASGKVKLNSLNNKYYAKDPIRKINGTCYYADTLGYNGSNRTKVIPGYTVEAPFDASLAEGAVKQSEVEVVEIVGAPCLDAWTVADFDYNSVLGADIGKKYGHNCICDVNFGHYLTKTNVAIEVKHQGNSAQSRKKRSYRYTFYKKNDFKKKDKIKLGEMLRLSGFNLKASYLDNSRIKEPLLYRIFSNLWEDRPITDRFNWDNKVNGLYHGATGNIKGFLMRLDVAGEFYGIYYFALKKDEKNYMLDGEDESGLFVSGQSTSRGWGKELDTYTTAMVKSDFDDEMVDGGIMDDTARAISRWHEFIDGRLFMGTDNIEYRVPGLTFFTAAEIEGSLAGHDYTEVHIEDGEITLKEGGTEIVKTYVTSTLEAGIPTESSVEANNVPFTKENIYSRLDVLGFIDYFICLQVFLMPDNLHNNVLLYSDAEKKKMFPFLYDLDTTIRTDFGYDADILNHNNPTTVTPQNMTLWEDFKDEYWDDIVNRYIELRKNILSMSFIEDVYNEYVTNVPTSDYAEESVKWGGTVKATNFASKIEFLQKRFEYLDNNYFII